MKSHKVRSTDEKKRSSRAPKDKRFKSDDRHERSSRSTASRSQSRLKSQVRYEQSEEEDEDSVFSTSSEDLGDGFSSSSQEEQDESSSDESEEEYERRRPRNIHAPSLDKPFRHLTNVKIKSAYDMGMKLGDGDFAKVYLGVHKKSGEEYAIKTINRTKMKIGKVGGIMEEIGNMTMVREGPCIVHVYEAYEETSNVFLVTELMYGGELFDRILDMSDFTEKDARDCTRCVLKAVKYMHASRVVHRDLRPENLLLVSDEDARLIVKVSDFGFAKHVKQLNSCRTLCGTTGYVAPEILERWPSYDLACDLWSVGCILFLLLGNYFPFQDDETDEDQVFERIRNGTYYFYPEYWANISKGAKELVSLLLTVNPNKRVTASGALEHEWMMTKDSALDKKELNIEKLQDSVMFAREQQDELKRSLSREENRITLLKEQFELYLEKKGTKNQIKTEQDQKDKSAREEKFIEDSGTGKPFDDFYDVGEMLGEGGYACVFQATHKFRSVTYAVKDVDLTMLEQGGEATLKDEIWALKLLRGGPHIVRLYDVFEEPDHVYLVMEEMKGGDLLTRIGDKEVYTEREARKVCRIIFEAMDYIHKMRIAHRDIKPENVLLVEKGDDTSIKIADFGFAKKVFKANSLRTLCGTAQYVAPEVLELKDTGYDTVADMWSVGVVVYILLGGYAPFEGPVDLLAQAIISGDYEFHEKYWDEISLDAKDMIKNLLQIDPDQRYTAELALQCPWMIVEDEKLSVKDLSRAKETISSTKSSQHEECQRGGAITTTTKEHSLGVEFTESLKNMGLDEGRNKEVFENTLGGISEDAETDVYEDSRSGKAFDELYKWGKQIGEGHFAVVHEVKHRQSREIYAVKRVTRTDLDTADAIALQDEITALQLSAGCPQVIFNHDVFEEPDHTYLVVEWMRGGSLIDRLNKKGHYEEHEAKEVAKQLFMGIEFLHNKRIANRNLKPENILLTSSASDVDIKISDFGFAKRVLYPYSLKTQCGTEGYVAPEVLEHRPAYDVQCDMWSLGVCLYLLLGGYRPFRGDTNAITKQIRYGEYKFHKRFWLDISDDAKHLITRLLTVNPALRITATLAMQSDWILYDDDDEELDDSSYEDELEEDEEQD